MLGNAWHLGVTKFLLASLPHPLSFEFNIINQRLTRPTFERQLFYDDLRLEPFRIPVLHLYREAADKCPFRQASPDRLWATSLPPSDAEMNAHRLRGDWTSQQEKRDTTSGGREPLLPRGLLPEEHFLCGAAVQTPFETTPPIAEDLDFAIETVVSQGSRIDSWRRLQFRTLQSICKSIEQVCEKTLDDDRSHHSKFISPDICLSRLDAAVKSIGWPDGLFRMVQRGARVTDELEPTGIFRCRRVEASLSKSELLATSAQFVDELMASPPPSSEKRQVIWEKSLKDLKSGCLGLGCQD